MFCLRKFLSFYSGFPRVKIIHYVLCFKGKIVRGKIATVQNSFRHQNVFMRAYQPSIYGNAWKKMHVEANRMVAISISLPIKLHTTCFEFLTIFISTWDGVTCCWGGDELLDHAQAIIVIIIGNSSKTVNQPFVRCE